MGFAPEAACLKAIYFCDDPGAQRFGCRAGFLSWRHRRWRGLEVLLQVAGLRDVLLDAGGSVFPSVPERGCQEDIRPGGLKCGAFRSIQGRVPPHSFVF